MTMPETEVPKTRRERGVQAQREYRKRQATKAQALQDENARLKAAIEHINTALALHGSRSQDLVAAIQAAKDVAGLADPDNVIAPGAAADESHDAPNESSSASGLAGDTEHGPVFDVRVEAGVTCIPTTITVSAGADAASPPAGTFAWCIYWRALNYQADIFDYQGCPARATVVKSAAQVDLAIQLAIPLGHEDMLDRLWARRLRYKKFGGREAEMFSRYRVHVPSATEVAERAREEYRTLQSFWRSAMAVEKIVWSVLDDDEQGDFQDAMRGSGNPRTVELVVELIESMAQNYYCMGEGPVWSCLWAHMSIGAWAAKLRNAGEDVRML